MGSCYLSWSELQRVVSCECQQVLAVTGRHLPLEGQADYDTPFPNQLSYIAKPLVGWCSRSCSDERVFFCLFSPHIRTASFLARGQLVSSWRPTSPLATTLTGDATAVPVEALLPSLGLDRLVHKEVASFPPITGCYRRH